MFICFDLFVCLQGRKKSVVSVEPRNLMQGSYPGCSVSGMTLKYMYGVNAWKNWVQWKNAQEEQGDLKFSGNFFLTQCKQKQLKSTWHDMLFKSKLGLDITEFLNIHEWRKDFMEYCLFMHLKVIAITFLIDLLPIKTGSKIPDFLLTLEMLVF